MGGSEQRLLQGQTRFLRAFSCWVLETSKDGACTTSSLSTPRQKPFCFHLCVLSLILSPSAAVRNPPSRCSPEAQAGCRWVPQSCPLPRLDRTSSLLPSSEAKCSRDDACPGAPGPQPAGGPGCCPGTLLACGFPCPDPQGISAELLPNHRLCTFTYTFYPNPEKLIQSFKLQLPQRIRSGQPFWFCRASSTSDFHMLVFL